MTLGGIANGGSVLQSYPAELHKHFPLLLESVAPIVGGKSEEASGRCLYHSSIRTFCHSMSLAHNFALSHPPLPSVPLHLSLIIFYLLWCSSTSSRADNAVGAVGAIMQVVFEKNRMFYMGNLWIIHG